jgi:hypothetical protein
VPDVRRPERVLGGRLIGEADRAAQPEADVRDRPELRAAAVGEQLLDDVAQLDLRHSDLRESNCLLRALTGDPLHIDEPFRRR